MISRLVNVPHASNTGAEMRAVISDNQVSVRCFTKKAWHESRMPNEEQSVEVCSMHIGDHMFEPKMRDSLLRAIGDSLESAIRQARDIGYEQARYEIRKALGVVGT